MAKRILLVLGHPDPSRQHLCHKLEDAYADAAAIAGHEIRRARGRARLSTLQEEIR